MSKISNLKKLTVFLGFIAVLTISLLCFAPAFAANDTDATSAKDDSTFSAPKHNKDITLNGDGTYSLSLNVTGDSTHYTEKNKTNIVIVLDTSGSMDNHIEVTYEKDAEQSLPDEYGFRKRWGIDESGNYIKLIGIYNSYENRYWTLNGKQYDGIVYRQRDVENSQTRLEQAQDSIGHFAEELAKQNTQEHPDSVEMALVQFASGAKVTQTPTTNAADITNALTKNVSAKGGTNWDYALELANNINFEDDDPTYIIFLSDGDPTYYGPSNDITDTPRDAEGNSRGTGYLTPDNIALCFKQAEYSGRSIIANGKQLTFVNCHGDATSMQKFVNYCYTGSVEISAPDGHYFTANDNQQFTDVITELTKEINKRAEYTDVTLTDTLTDCVELANGAVTPNFAYYKTTSDGTETEFIPDNEATYNPETKTISWNVVGYPDTLETDVTYKVTFDIQLAQDTKALAIDFKRGTKEWNETDYPFITKKGQGYEVQTNVNKTDQVTYSIITDDGNVTSSSQTVPYNPTKIPMPTPAIVGSEPYADAPALGVTKNFTGRDIKTTDKFSFELNPINPAPMLLDENGNPVATAKITITGETPNLTAGFDEILYPGVGTFIYKITESHPDDAATITNEGGVTTGYKLNGITYSAEEYNVIVNVTLDEDNNQYIPIVTIKDQDENVVAPPAETNNVTFTNTYKQPPASNAEHASNNKVLAETGDNLPLLASCLVTLGILTMLIGLRTHKNK